MAVQWAPWLATTGLVSSFDIDAREYECPKRSNSQILGGARVQIILKGREYWIQPRPNNQPREMVTWTSVVIFSGWYHFTDRPVKDQFG